jgi:hypothetical protein
MNFLDCTCFSSSLRIAIIYLVETMTQSLARLVDVKRLTLDRAARRPACGGRLRRTR